MLSNRKKPTFTGYNHLTAQTLSKKKKVAILLGSLVVVCAISIAAIYATGVLPTQTKGDGLYVQTITVNAMKMIQGVCQKIPVVKSVRVRLSPDQYNRLP